jgi:CubicO group peptidase (beta-lactamase class C family)
MYPPLPVIENSASFLRIGKKFARGAAHSDPAVQSRLVLPSSAGYSSHLCERQQDQGATSSASSASAIHGSRQPRRGGSLYSAQAFEHNGRGGTYLWVDPTYELVGVYFSLLMTGAPGLNPPWRADLFSNMVTAAILDEETSTDRQG